MDDLAFDMYQDPEVAQIIRRLDERKREAVHRECYDQAKQLKQAIADLQKVLLTPPASLQLGRGLAGTWGVVMIPRMFSKQSFRKQTVPAG